MIRGYLRGFDARFPFAIWWHVRLKIDKTHIVVSIASWKTNFEPKSSNVNFSTIGLVYIPLRGKHSLNPTVLRGLISLIYAFANKIWLTLYGSLKLKENEPVNQNTMIF